MIAALSRANYPKCDVVHWDKPVEESCPHLSAPLLLAKTTKKGRNGTLLPKVDCDYKMAVDNADTVLTDQASDAVTTETR